MNTAEVLDIGSEAIFTLLTVAAPIMGVALAVGLAISLFQALTQIQEMMLSFVPKIAAIFITFVLALPYMMATMMAFGESLYGRIAGIG